MKNNIYVISLSPAIDYILKFDDFLLNKTNRPYYTEMYPAGKGIHISMILNNLGFANESLIFSSGKFEEYFYKYLDIESIKYKKFNSKGDIRINIKIIDSQQTECSVLSPEIDANEIEKLFKYLRNNAKTNDYIIATGSIPNNVGNDIYSKIAVLSNEIGCKFVIDSYGTSLLEAVNKKPFLIKPNKDELSLTLNKKIESDEDIIEAGNTLLNKGVENILVSLGSEGAIFMNKNNVYKASIGKWNHNLVNAAGAGDSMLAGFISKYIEKNNFKESLIMGIVCGSATAFSNKIASKDLIDNLLENVSSIKLDILK
ncbi:1-phosphofructokinase [Spiroplasma litorale]|uniref:1-phosphofructokinase n=1 Tax=Spiroplasma litorale TaxID=216942 RepID=A0A0K1W1S7_9MOLU|nr:1-phosphofructokinase family hexose kinase [Spiroplasma litorale]AKX34260.1 1-phosphofructokinase [Spiroplasma litorale]